MIRPEEVRARALNITPYEDQIDMALGAPWTQEMREGGRIVSLVLPIHIAKANHVFAAPTEEQKARLRTKYEAAGWKIRSSRADSDTWIFDFPETPL